MFWDVQKYCDLSNVIFPEKKMQLPHQVLKLASTVSCSTLKIKNL